MAKINIAERMGKVLETISGFKPGIERDVEIECEDTWDADHAIIMLNVMEPDDDFREYFELDKFVHDFATHAAHGAGRGPFRSFNRLVEAIEVEMGRRWKARQDALDLNSEDPNLADLADMKVSDYNPLVIIVGGDNFWDDFPQSECAHDFDGEVECSECGMNGFEHLHDMGVKIDALEKKVRELEQENVALKAQKEVR